MASVISAEKRAKVEAALQHVETGYEELMSRRGLRVYRNLQSSVDILTRFVRRNGIVVFTRRPDGTLTVNKKARDKLPSLMEQVRRQLHNIDQNQALKRRMKQQFASGNHKTPKRRPRFL